MSTTTINPILVRRDTKQSWSQAKRLEVLKDMSAERLASWIEQMNDSLGWAKYRAA